MLSLEVLDGVKANIDLEERAITNERRSLIFGWCPVPGGASVPRCALSGMNKTCR